VSERPKKKGGKPTAGAKTGNRASSKATPKQKPKPAPRPPRPPVINPATGMPVQPPAASGTVIRVARMFETSASAVYSCFNDPNRRAWSPEPLYRVLSALAPRFVRLALPDGTELTASITRQGNTRCAVTVEVIGLPDRATAANATARWRHALDALAEQLDADWG
jgi:hypothetical protein